MSYYIQRTRNQKVRYWTGKTWDMEEAKGYKSESSALNAARRICKNCQGFSDELTIEKTTTHKEG